MTFQASVPPCSKLNSGPHKYTSVENADVAERGSERQDTNVE